MNLGARSTALQRTMRRTLGTGVGRHGQMIPVSFRTNQSREN